MDLTKTQQKVALVTGTASKDGIGFATAELLAGMGYQVHLADISPQVSDRVRDLREGGYAAYGYCQDLTQWDGVKQMVADIVQKSQRIDVLVNNAGMAVLGSEEPLQNMEDIEMDDWNYSLAINLNTVFNVTKAVLPVMKQHHYGRIVTTSSVTGPIVSNPGESAYAAAKAGIIGLVRSLAIEIGKNGITVNAVAPGWIATAAASPEEMAGGSNTPLGRSGTPREVAHAIVFMASPEASYITGQLLVVDGGNTIQEYKGPSELYY